jgi:hypothetical protein
MHIFIEIWYFFINLDGYKWLIKWFLDLYKNDNILYNLIFKENLILDYKNIFDYEFFHKNFYLLRIKSRFLSLILYIIAMI